MVLCALNESSCTSDERVPGGAQGNTVRLSALAASRVVCDFTHVFVDSERLSSDGRLVHGNDGVALDDRTFLVVIITTVLLVIRIGGIIEFVLLLQLEVFFEVFRVVVAADKSDIGRDGLAFLDNDLIE